MVARTALSRTATLTTIRIASLAVGIGAAVFGIVLLLGSISPSGSVWTPTGDGSGAGSLMALPLPLRLVRASTSLAAGLTIATIAFLLADLARRVKREVRFVPALSRTVTALAVTLAVGSTITRILANIGRWSGTISEVDPRMLSSGEVEALPIEWAAVNAQTLAPNWPMLGIAVILGLLAFIISSGERLQRDSEGLV